MTRCLRNEGQLHLSTQGRQHIPHVLPAQPMEELNEQ